MSETIECECGGGKTGCVECFGDGFKPAPSKATLREIAEKEARDVIPQMAMAQVTRNRALLADAIERVAKEFAERALDEAIPMAQEMTNYAVSFVYSHREIVAAAISAADKG